MQRFPVCPHRIRACGYDNVERRQGRLPESFTDKTFQPVARHRARVATAAYGQTKARYGLGLDRKQCEVRQARRASLGKHPPKIRPPEQAGTARETMLRDMRY